jgi:hypothetical protein
MAHLIATLTRGTRVLTEAELESVTTRLREAAATDRAHALVTAHGAVTLSLRELRYCKEAGANPAHYAANKALLLAGRPDRRP